MPPLGVGIEEEERAAAPCPYIVAISNTAFPPISLASLLFHLQKVHKSGCDV